ncbi:hypothetical protein Tco_0489777 [Tanacetum coccineum]
MDTLINFSKYVLNRLKIDNLTLDLLLGPACNLLKGTCTSSIKLEYNFQECFNALKDKLDWNNPEGDHCPFDLSKPLPLQGHPSHLTVAADYFFNNDLEYLKSSDPKKMYTTSITNTKAAQYEIMGIKDMSVSVKKLHVYGHLEEIVVKRADRQLYKFKEGDFVDLHLNEIEDILLLDVQHKLFHLNGSDIVDFIVALRMFTRSLVIKKRVEDLQLGADELYKFSDGTLKKFRMSFITKYSIFVWDTKTRCQGESGRLLTERVLRIILVILLEHQSDTKVFTMTMEILLEPTSNKLCGRNQYYKLESYQGDSSLKINLPDHRSNTMMCDLENNVIKIVLYRIFDIEFRLLLIFDVLYDEDVIRYQPERPETEDDFMGDDLKQYEADIDAMNLILISIPNDIYNFVDSGQTANECGFGSNA